MSDSINIILTDDLGNDLNPYVKPATTSTLGTIKVGSNLSITADGTLSATGGGGGSLPSQEGKENYVLSTDGVDPFWVATTALAYPIIDAYNSGYTWYYVIQINSTTKLCIQGSRFQRTQAAAEHISLAKSYKNSSYMVLLSLNAKEDYTAKMNSYASYIYSKTTSSFYAVCGTTYTNLLYWSWMAIGLVS